jgi:predicted nucleic acid-binding protein
MSIISRIELLGFAFPEPVDEAKAVKFVEESTLLPLSDEVADLAIEIRKKHKTKLGDTLIAATAIAHNLSLLTRNDADFKNIEGLKIINPFLV